MNESAVPVEVDPSIQKAVALATMELRDKLATTEGQLAKANAYLNAPSWIDDDDVPTGRAKGWFNDPFALLDSLGMGYRANPSQVTYDTLRQMTERDTLLAAIINTRIHQVSAFCRPQENKYSVGYKIRPRGDDKNRRLDDAEKRRVARIRSFLTDMGIEPNITRDGFVPFMMKMVRDRLTYDQVNFEKVYTRGGSLYEVLAHDASTIRIAQPRDARGGPVPVHYHRNAMTYVQLINGEIVAEFSPRELAFCIANARSSIRANGYGLPEPQTLIMTVTAHLWAEEWNRRAFSQGSTIRGVLNMKGTINRQNYNDFKRQWTAQVSGVTNAWRTPILNSDGIEFIPMQMSNTEMGYQMWIEYLVKIACAIYQMDPTEINFDLRGSTGQQPVFMSNNEAQQKVSKDRGLKPLLHYLEDCVNRHIVHALDDQFELAFVGLDAKTEEQAIELRLKQGQSHVTVNELRALDDMDPIPNADVVANPTLMAYVQQKEMAAMQGGGGGGPPGAGGPPGGGDDQQQQQPQQQQPYAGRLGEAGDKPTGSAMQAQKKLSAMANSSKQQGEAREEEAPYMRFLRRDDWESTVHASLTDQDLKKSERDDEEVVYYDISL